MSKDHAKPTPRNPQPAAVPDPKLDALAAGKAAGSVKFDDRGNAIWQFAETPEAFSRDSSTARLKRLDNPALSIADDDGEGGPVRANPLGTLKGYNPYESGQLAKPAADKPKKRTDLRKLGEWMKLRKQAVKTKQDP